MPGIAARIAEPTLQDELAALGDDGVFDRANLGSGRTGIEGVVFISTAMGAHGPRVTYFQKGGKDQPSFSISISQSPRVLASSLPDRVVAQMSPEVIRWVALNRAALLSFWNDGDAWMAEQVEEFISDLRAIGARSS